MGWLGVCAGLRQALSRNELDQYDVRYIQMEMYAVLCKLRSNASRITARNRKTTSEYCTWFTGEMDAVVKRLSTEHQTTFLHQEIAIASMQASIARATFQSPPDSRGAEAFGGGAPAGPRARHQPTVHRTGHKGGLCGQDLLHQYRIAESGNGGAIYEACRFGEGCRRTHLRNLERKFTKAVALKQMQGCVYVESERADLSAKINADTISDFAA